MPLASATKIGCYEIVSPLGAGGMGEVYRARDTRLGRQVAVKVLPEAFAADADRMGRFEREARVLASLNHPNIASIYGYEDSGGVHALVMELVEGPTLADRVAQGPIAVDEALPIAQQIAEALEYAHERGIVHRDLKPANVKVTLEGGVKILDFGLAKALEGERESMDMSSSPTLSRMATQAGIILGTAAYMSPEQAKGKPVDRRTDIWAFGCVLYEMLTGKQAFGGETTTDILAAIVRAEPDWSLLPSATRTHVRVLLRRCLQKDAKQRLRDIGDARISVEEVLAGSTESFTNAGLSLPAGRRALPWLLASLLAGALIAGLAVWMLIAPGTPEPMHFSAVTTFAGVQAQPALSPDGRSIAFVSNRDGHYNIYVGLVTGGNLVQITNDVNLKARPVWSPDGTTVAYARLNASGIWDVWEVPALGGTSRRVILNATDPAWSPDGHSLAYENVADGSLWVSGSAGENPHEVVPNKSDEYRTAQPRFSPDGRQLAFAVLATGPYGHLSILDLGSGKIRRLTDDSALDLSPAWSPDSRHVFFTSSRGGTMNIWEISVSGGTPQQITAGQGDDAQLDVSADGNKIVFSTWRANTNIAALDLTAKAGQQIPHLLTSDPARNQIAPAYSPDGKYLTYFSNMKGAENESIWVSNADGSNPLLLVRDNRINVFPMWTTDSLNVIYESEPLSGTAKEYEYRSVPVSGGVAKTVAKNGGHDFFDVGLDGRLLLRTLDDRTEVFDPRTGTTRRLEGIPGNTYGAPLRWSPDGGSVAYVLTARREDDPAAGLWVTDFKNPPRHLFRGWVDGWIVRGSDTAIYFIEGKPDLNGVVCKIAWNGQGLLRTRSTIPLLDSYWIDPAQNPQDYFSVSPDGRRVAFETQTVLGANIGMVERVR